MRLPHTISDVNIIDFFLSTCALIPSMISCVIFYIYDHHMISCTNKYVDTVHSLSIWWHIWFIIYGQRIWWSYMNKCLGNVYPFRMIPYMNTHVLTINDRIWFTVWSIPYMIYRIWLFWLTVYEVSVYDHIRCSYMEIRMSSYMIWVNLHIRFYLCDAERAPHTPLGWLGAGPVLGAGLTLVFVMVVSPGHGRVSEGTFTHLWLGLTLLMMLGGFR